MFLSEHLAILAMAPWCPSIMMLGVIMIAAPGAPGGGVSVRARPAHLHARLLVRPPSP